MSNFIDRASSPDFVENKVVTQHASVTSIAKRGMDIVLSLVGLAFALPLMVLIAVLIKSSGRGSVLFAQERIGLHGQTFSCFK
ncbi:MAG: sugar transferase, partial [Pseudomonadota bacterium]|nr:sugar transferase [Pseudomonadota bacterium]